jgi:hypothetical protein
MPKRPKLRPDMNEVAYRIVQAATGQGLHPEPPGVGEKNAEAVERGRQGGKKGGKARAKKLTPRERTGVAQPAALVRWKQRRADRKAEDR